MSDDIKSKIKKKETENDKQEIRELKEIVEKLLIENKTTTITNNTNNSTNNSNNTTNNMTNNIIIHNYGDEDTKYITSDFILNLLKFKPAKVIPELIKHTHFNEAHPENHNIKITNKKDPYIKVRKDDKWLLQDKKEIIENLVDDKYYILEDHYVELSDTILKEHTKSMIETFIDRFSSDEELLKTIKKKTEMVILNNSQ